MPGRVAGGNFAPQPASRQASRDYTPATGKSALNGCCVRYTLFLHKYQSR